jgi:glutamine synthetase
MKALREQLAAQGVHTLLAQFTDLHGVARGKLVPLAHLDDLLTTAPGFSGPSIGAPACRVRARGPSTTRAASPAPHRPALDAGRGAHRLRRLRRRRALRRLPAPGAARASPRGWRKRAGTCSTGIEPEFFLLRRDGARWRPADPQDRLDKPSYDLKSLPAAQASWPSAARRCSAAAWTCCNSTTRTRTASTR